MKNAVKIALCAAVAVMMALPTSAQVRRETNYVTIQISPDHADWVYKVGEDVKFTFAVMKDTYPQENMQVSWEWGPDKLAPTTKGTLETGKGYHTMKVKGMNKPGFMTMMCKITVDGVNYSNYTTVAFEPDNIKPTCKLPGDFADFWKGVLESTRKVPMEPTMTLVPESCTPYADVYHVRFQNGSAGRYVYGMLSMPKGDGPFPVLLRVPGAGVRPYTGDRNYAPHGIIHMEIGIHGIPVNMPGEAYTNLRAGALSGYNTFNYDNKDKYYYKHVYAGCVRTIDFLLSLPQADKDRVGVHGGSQGGALSIIVASLDERVKCLAADYPALCDISGYYNGSTGGWPHFFRSPDETNIKTKVAVSEYYDVVNFARSLKAPVLFGIGYNDQVCPPTSQMAAYNVIPGPKTMQKTNDSAHWRYPESSRATQMWLIEQLKK